MIGDPRRPVALLGGIAVLVCVLWFLAVPVDSSVTSDDGAYAIQASAVSEGEWAVPHRVHEHDPTGSAYPYQNSTVGTRGIFPGARHAVWAAAQAVGYGVFGVVGLRVLPVLGFAVAAAACPLLARRAGRPEVGVVAGALVLGSPLLFNGLQLWAHAPATAFVTLAMIVALRVLDGHVSPFSAAGLPAATFLAAALRSEGAIFGLAVALVVVGGALRRRHVAALVLGGVSAGAALAGYAVTSRLSDAITGSVLASTSSGAAGAASRSGTVASSIGGAIQTLFAAPEVAGAFLLTVTAVALVVVAAVAAASGDNGRSALLLAGAAVVWVVRIAIFREELVTGLVGAWPIVVFAGARRWSALSAGERRLVLMVGVAAVGVLATQYDQGGGLNWGGRFVSPAIPALAVVAAGALVAMTDAHRGRILAVAAVALATTVTAASLVADASARIRHDRIVARLDDAPDAPVVTANQPLPRIAWRTHPSREWLLIPTGTDAVDGARTLRELLLRSGVDEVVLFGVPAAQSKELTGESIPSAATEEPLLVRLRS